MIRVTVFDDNQSFLEGISLLLSMQEEFYLAGSYSDARHLEKNLLESKPDVVVMDIQMPEISGIEAVKKIKSWYPEVPVIMLTMFEDDHNIIAAIAAGAAGYLIKGASHEEMLAAFRQIHQGGSPMSPGIARKVMQLFGQHLQFIPEDYKLTQREKEILSSMVDGLSYKMIASRLDISYHTVNAHIRKIYEKLQVNSSHEAVAKALKERVV